jgi:predicted nucleic acid-binding OB-fold protein
MLSTKNIHMQKVSKKFTDRYVDFFKIFEAIGRNVYKLNLLKDYKRIYFTFYISLLERYRRREGA